MLAQLYDFFSSCLMTVLGLRRFQDSLATHVNARSLENLWRDNLTTMCPTRDFLESAAAYRLTKPIGGSSPSFMSTGWTFPEAAAFPL